MQKHKDELSGTSVDEVIRAMYQPALIFNGDRAMKKDSIAEFELVTSISTPKGPVFIPILTNVTQFGSGAKYAVIQSIYGKNVYSADRKSNALINKIRDRRVIYADPGQVQAALVGRSPLAAINGSQTKSALPTSAQGQGGILIPPSFPVKPLNNQYVGWDLARPFIEDGIRNKTIKTDTTLMRWIGNNFRSENSPDGWDDVPIFSAKEPYADAPDNLMGYRKHGPQAGFGEQAYKHVEFVRVTWDDGGSMVDAMSGLNKAHTLERARRNWKDAKIQAITRAEAEAEDPTIGQDADAMIHRSERDQTETPEFKKWYGNWQGEANGNIENRGAVEGGGRGVVVETSGDDGARGHVQSGRVENVNTVQRYADMGKDSAGSIAVGSVTFKGSSGPVGTDGKPVVFFHGTREDFSVFHTDHPTRADLGWLGRGVYVTSSSDLAETYAIYIKRGSIGESVMPLYANVRNPYVTTNETKKDLKNKSQEQIDQFTQKIKDQGYDGVAMPFDDGHIELVVFDPAQVKSAIGNNGNFDGSDPDISHSMRSGTSTWDMDAASKFDDIVFKLQNKHIDTKRVIQSIIRYVGQVADDLNVYLQEELFHGRAAKRTEDFAAQELKPLMQSIKRAGSRFEHSADIPHFGGTRH